jgi:hypothetical protein
MYGCRANDDDDDIYIILIKLHYNCSISGSLKFNHGTDKVTNSIQREQVNTDLKYTYFPSMYFAIL